MHYEVPDYLLIVFAFRSVSFVYSRAQLEMTDANFPMHRCIQRCTHRKVKADGNRVNLTQVRAPHFPRLRVQFRKIPS